MIYKFFDPNKGTWVLISFIAFFALIVFVNGVFITNALRTHSGVVTDQPYEKGLAYDTILKKAREQADINQEVSYEQGLLKWSLYDKNNKPINGEVSAQLVRPVKSGHDFKVDMIQVAPGQYEAEVELPMRGRWEALLKAKWQNQHYQKRMTIIAD